MNEADQRCGLPCLPQEQRRAVEHEQPDRRLGEREAGDGREQRAGRDGRGGQVQNAFPMRAMTVNGSPYWTALGL